MANRDESPLTNTPLPNTDDTIMQPGSAAEPYVLTLHRRTLRFAVSVLAQLEYPGSRLVGGDALGQGWRLSGEGLLWQKLPDSLISEL